MFKPTLLSLPLAIIFAATPVVALDDETPLVLDLQNVVSIALKQNSDIAIAKRQAEFSAQRKREAVGLALPDMDVSSSYRREGNIQKYELAPGQSIQFQPDDNYTVAANFNQWIYSGSVFAGLKGANHLIASSKANVKAIRNNVITDVKIKFSSALFNRELISVNEESVKQLRSHLKDSKDREAVGLNTAYDTMRFETKLAEAIPKLIKSRNDYDKALAALLDSLGMNPLAKVELSGVFKYKPLSISLDKGIETALAHRPEIAVAKENVAVAKETANAIKSELMPSLKAFGKYQRSNSQFNENGEFGWRDEWNAGVKFEMNLFDGMERSARYRQKIIEHHIAKLRSEKIRREVLIDVRTAYNDLKRAKEFMESQEKSVEYAKETYRIISERLKQGMATQLELLDTQLDYTTAKTNRTRSLYEYSMAHARLQRAVGMVNEVNE